MVTSKMIEDENRRALREEFETVTSALRNSDDMIQTIVGASINIASTFFHNSYPNDKDFQKLPNSERISYINKLTDTEIAYRDEMGDPHLALGFALFKMWVGAVSACDTELMKQFNDELEYFSKKGEGMGMALMS